MSHNSEEKRKYIRLNAGTEARLKVKNSQGKSAGFENDLAFVRNISLEGVGLAYDKPLNIDDKVELELYLQDDLQPTHITGQVRRIKEFDNEQHQEFKYEIGIKILSISKEDEYKFTSYVWKKIKEL